MAPTAGVGSPTSTILTLITKYTLYRQTDRCTILSLITIHHFPTGAAACVAVSAARRCGSGRGIESDPTLITRTDLSRA